MHGSPRRAVTLVELLVAIGVVAVLMAVLMPVVLKGREAARRTQCINNLKQIGVAMIQHDLEKGRLPSNGGWDGVQTIQAKDGTPQQVRTENVHTGLVMHWGVGQPGRAKQDQTGSWAYHLLPFIDRKDLYDARDWKSAVRIYICGSRRPAVATPAVNDAHGQYFGGGWDWARTDYAANEFVVPNRPDYLPASRINDGRSMTILAGEKALAAEIFATGSWFWDEPYFVGGSGGTQRHGTLLVPDSTATAHGTMDHNWGSPHDAGVNMLFADGSVRTLAFETSSALMAALLTPNGHEAVPKF